MAKKKKKKTKAFNPLEGYISTSNPVQPTIEKDIFGTESLTAVTRVLPELQAFTLNNTFTPRFIRAQITDGTINVYTIPSGDSFMLTALTLSMRHYVHAEIPYKGIHLDYVLAIGGNVQFCKMIGDSAGSSQTITLSFPIPIKFDSTVYDRIELVADNAYFEAECCLIGYDIKN